jgi:hypothetical protein
MNNTYHTPNMSGKHFSSYENSSHRKTFTGVLNTVQDCVEMCERMSTSLLRAEDVDSRVYQLKLLRDCADICTAACQFMARNSHFSNAIAQLCAFICETCGNECLKFQDQESQFCGYTCLHCAKECRALLGY